MKYTKKQRHKIYCKMLRYLLDHPNYGFNSYWSGGLCNIYKEITGDYPYNKMERIPEILEQKPAQCERAIWWDNNEEGNQQRIQALQVAIMATMD